MDLDEKKEVINEANKIFDVKQCVSVNLSSNRFK